MRMSAIVTTSIRQVNCPGCSAAGTRYVILSAISLVLLFTGGIMADTSLKSLKETALSYFQQAYQAQMEGRLEEAEALYKKSIEIYPTAEAHTYLGWTYSFQ